MGHLDEADSQYRRAVELEPGSAAFKAEANLVDIVRNNLKQGRQCLEEGDARYMLNPPPPNPSPKLLILTHKILRTRVLDQHSTYLHSVLQTGKMSVFFLNLCLCMCVMICPVCSGVPTSLCDIHDNDHT